MPVVKVPAPMHRCGAGRRPFPQCGYFLLDKISYICYNDYELLFTSTYSTKL